MLERKLNLRIGHSLLLIKIYENLMGKMHRIVFQNVKWTFRHNSFETNDDKTLSDESAMQNQVEWMNEWMTSIYNLKSRKKMKWKIVNK